MSNKEDFFESKTPKYAWVMVFVVFVLSGLAFGSLASISVFLKPISSDLGWSRGETSFAYTVASFSAAFLSILRCSACCSYFFVWTHPTDSEAPSGAP